MEKKGKSTFILDISRVKYGGQSFSVFYFQVTGTGIIEDGLIARSWTGFEPE